MSKLTKNKSVVFDVQPQDISAHKLWMQALAQEQEKWSKQKRTLKSK